MQVMDRRRDSGPECGRAAKGAGEMSVRMDQIGPDLAAERAGGAQDVARVIAPQVENPHGRSSGFDLLDERTPAGQGDHLDPISAPVGMTRQGLHHPLEPADLEPFDEVGDAQEAHRATLRALRAGSMAAGSGALPESGIPRRTNPSAA